MRNQSLWAKLERAVRKRHRNQPIDGVYREWRAPVQLWLFSVTDL